MKFLLDFLPLAFFFMTYKWGSTHPEQAMVFLQSHFDWLIHGQLNQEVAPTLLATVGVTIASIIQIVVMKAMRKPIGAALWIGLAIILVMGSLTLWFSSPIFIKLKPTILYGVFGSILMIGQFTKHNLLQRMLGSQIPLPERAWRIATWQWAGFFFSMAILNTWIALAFSEDTWVNFKVWGSSILMIVFSVLQMLSIAKHLPKDIPPPSQSQ